MIDEYTRVLEIAAESGEERVGEEAVAKLVLHLKSMGRLKMLSEIAKKLRIISARRAALMPVVEVASSKEASRALAAAKNAGIATKKAQVNSSLIRGFRARGQGLLVDRSAKRVLLDVYQQSIT